jgi:OOP family OmpA-OmpF porin
VVLFDPISTGRDVQLERVGWEVLHHESKRHLALYAISSRLKEASMRFHKALLPLLATTALVAGGVVVSACHAEAEAKLATAPTPSAPEPPPPPPPPASTTAEPPPPPPPPPPPKKVISLRGVQMKSATQIDMPGDIEFQTGSSKINLSDKSKKVLTQLLAILKDNTEVTKLSVEGNTDNEGEDKGFDNVKLSKDRSQAVVDYLTKNGVDAKRLNAIGLGSKNPLKPNDSAANKATNRRVEFHVREFNGEPVSSDDSSASTAAAAASVDAGAPDSGTDTSGKKTTTTVKKKAAVDAGTK